MFVPNSVKKKNEKETGKCKRFRKRDDTNNDILYKFILMKPERMQKLA